MSNMMQEFTNSEAVSVMRKIQAEAENINTYLKRCNAIIDDSVGVEKVWSGQRANDFKQKWEQSSANFSVFYNMINGYANRIYKAAERYEELDSAKN